MGTLLLFLIFFAAPAAAITFFVVSLVKLISGISKNKKIPYTVSPNKMRVRKICLIVSSAILLIFIAIFVAIIILLAAASAFM